MSEQPFDEIGQPTSSCMGVKTKTVAAIASNAWNINMNNGNINNNNNKTNTNRVRAISATSSKVYDIPLSSIIEAYDNCCANKRSATDCVRFYSSYEMQLVHLWQQICHGDYTPSPSTAFIVNKPVKREIFAAAFVDRVVHHWICMRIEPLIESHFMECGDVSMNCRKGHGCQVAVRRLDSIIKRVSGEYTRDAWVFKGDIQSFFMSMPKSLIWEIVSDFLEEHYHGEDKDCLLYLLRITIFNHPEEACIRKSPVSYWIGLPPNKSLFGSDPDRGMAIGNLPTQLLANFFATCLDLYIMKKLGYDGDYLRFVDDFAIVTVNLPKLKDDIPFIDHYLNEQMLLTLHPKKRYLQHYSKGIPFVGAVIKPGRIYISNRTRGNLYRCIHKYNGYARDGMAPFVAEKFIASLNSYFGLMIHYDTYGVRRKAIRMLEPVWWEYLYVKGHFEVIALKKKYRSHYIMKHAARDRMAVAKILMPELMTE